MSAVPIADDRLLSLFLELVRIDSLSRKEGRIAARLERELAGLGAEKIWTDDAGERVGGETGNLIGLFPGTVPSAPPLLLCAHMDTVAPGEGVRPVVEGDVVRSDGTTVLGGDDKSGIAIVCEVIRALRERDVPHGPIDVVFTICEEKGLLGARHLDASTLRARTGFVFDSDVPGSLFVRAPGARSIRVVVEGLASHAGMAPEQGINAIQVASEAIAGMRLGRIDEETTANLGLVEGGRAINIVPDRVEIRGEARSHDDAKLDSQIAHMRERFDAAIGRHRVVVAEREHVARVTFETHRQYWPMKLSEDASIVRTTVTAGERLGLPVAVGAMGGGCDANILNERGFAVANLATGMREIHTTSEWIRLSDMSRAAAVLFETIRLHAESTVS